MPYRQPCTTVATSRRYRSGLVVAAGNDAAFRNWGSELDYNLDLAGLVQTADTGQIDWTTAVFPGANNTAAGYTIWRFNDGLQIQAPVYIKFEYGRGGAANIPMMWITVGTGTDNAGTITGTYFPRQIIFVNAAPQADTAANPTWSFITVADGFLGIAFKTLLTVSVLSTAGITGTMVGGVFLSRTTDIQGNSSVLGITMLSHNQGGGNPLSQICRRFQTTAATFGTYNCAGLIRGQGAPAYPAVIATGGTTGTSRKYQDDAGAYSTKMQVYPIWTTMIRTMSLAHVCTVIAADYPIGTMFYAPVIGLRKRRFIVVGARAGVVVANTIGVPYLAMLWE